MNKYIATFFSHYDALTFFNLLKKKDIKVKLAPVPRKVSASCGTCVLFEADSVADFTNCELEVIYAEDGSGGFVEVWVGDGD